MVWYQGYDQANLHPILFLKLKYPAEKGVLTERGLSGEKKTRLVGGGGGENTSLDRFMQVEYANIIHS